MSTLIVFVEEISSVNKRNIFYTCGKTFLLER